MYTFLLKNNDIDVDQQTVANAIREGKISERHGRSDCQNLALNLEEKGFISRIHLDEKGVIMSMFFIYRLSLAWLKAYWRILVLDATYKTNR
jgi:hypothetical protein